MEKQLSSSESLALITEMIKKAKKEAAGDGSFQLLLWGWVIALCNFGHYFLAKSGYEMPYVVWLAVIPAAIWSFVHEYREKRKARIKSHLDELLGQLWITVFSGMIIVLSFMGVLGFNHNPVILILAGIGVFCSGAIIKDKSVKIGGLVLFLGSIVGFLMPMEEQYLVGGIAMILGYLMPGYVLKNKFKSRV
ncbi:MULTISPECIES: hypothetical protein [Algoriphagus]|uniref:Uncharacterized protein n=1 Tax=Algoriphagus taiwanensis TaxID=1445656 RepID=A0ABQ6Q4K1_9BACT|nr:hypothetical protein Aoki45_19950 [Algoriphagus sp. oki45]GMQ35111.1 hypothetical protein Ataiwa_33840 [Algoriphagus taiwanensis]